MQRFFDILFSGVALLILSPLLLPLIVILRITGEGEVFFPQSRVGRKGTHFKLYKFATMLKDSPNMDTGTVTVKNDPRVLPMGRFLRKTKINGSKRGESKTSAIPEKIISNILCI